MSSSRTRRESVAPMRAAVTVVAVERINILFIVANTSLLTRNRILWRETLACGVSHKTRQ